MHALIVFKLIILGECLILYCANFVAEVELTKAKHRKFFQIFGAQFEI